TCVRTEIIRSAPATATLRVVAWASSLWAPDTGWKPRPRLQAHTHAVWYRERPPFTIEIMESLFRYVATPSPCGYLPEQQWQLEYEYVLSLSAEEYMQRMAGGWRRFGNMLFRPQGQGCSAGQPLRVIVDRFRPNRSQRRCRKINEGTVQLRIGVPKVTRAKLELYDRFHAYQSETKGWPWHEPKDAESYVQ